jgi:hypothetical protein
MKTARVQRFATISFSTMVSMPERLDRLALSAVADLGAEAHFWKIA